MADRLLKTVSNLLIPGDLGMDADFLEKTMSLFKLQEGQQKTCAVCSEVAHSCNFGVITCDPCKAFFRRNAHKENIIEKCNRKCDITGRLRSSCQSCRLRKCFDKGMKKELILTDEMKMIRKRKIEANRVKRLNLAIGSPSSSKQNSPCSSALGSPLPHSPDNYQQNPHHHDKTKLRTSRSCGQLSDVVNPSLPTRSISHTYGNHLSPSQNGGNWFNFDVHPQIPPCEKTSMFQNVSDSIMKQEMSGELSDCVFQGSPQSPFDHSPQYSTCHLPFDCCNTCSGQERTAPSQRCNNQQLNNQMPIQKSKMYSNSCDIENGMCKLYAGSKQFGQNPDYSLHGKNGLTRLAFSCPAFSMSETNTFSNQLKSSSFTNIMSDMVSTYNTQTVASTAVSSYDGGIQFGRKVESKHDEHLASTESELPVNTYRDMTNCCMLDWAQKGSYIKTETNDVILQSCSNCAFAAVPGMDKTQEECIHKLEPHLQDIAHNMVTSFYEYLKMVLCKNKAHLTAFDGILSTYEDCIRKGVKLTRYLKPFQELDRNGHIELLQNNLLDLVHIMFLHLQEVNKLPDLLHAVKQTTPLIDEPQTHWSQYAKCYESAKASLAPIQDDAIVQSCLMCLVLFRPNTQEEYVFLHSDFVLTWHKTFWHILQSYASQRSGQDSNLLKNTEDFLSKISALGQAAKKMLSSCSMNKLSPLLREAFDIH